MIKNSVTTLCLFLVLGFSIGKINAQDTFKGIVPMVMTKAEVEKKFGQPDKYNRYDFEDGIISIHYLEKECDKMAVNCNCFVPIGTVLRVLFLPNQTVTVESLNLDPKLWMKSPVKGHIEGIDAYINHKSGITYYVQRGEVSEVTLNASEEICKQLRQKAKP